MRILIFLWPGSRELRLRRPFGGLLGQAFGLGLSLLIWSASGGHLQAATGAWRVRHEPVQPRAGAVVRIAVEGGELPAGAVLEYQDVAPGRYVARADPGFAKGWVTVPLVKNANGGWSAEVPAQVQVNRHLVRYRVRAAGDGGVVLPPKDDTQGNYGYFVYDGVPAWRGAVNPRGAGEAREVRTFPATNLTRVPVYFFLAADRAVEETILKGSGDRYEYRFTGTFVYEGVVYDHVGFRARGGGWRHAMGKNMWKFNFNSGHRLAARDFYGRPYAAKWDKLNLGACIQQADYGMRGEQGMFDALSYRLFNLAGVEAPRTHWIHLRVVTGAEETPADQYRGDFWGLYQAVEEIDGAFLKEHRLPDGNLYKIEVFGPKMEHVAAGQPEDAGDAREFIDGILGGRGKGRDRWWEDSVDLPRYYGYRAILEAVHHYDLDAGKNYFFYHNLPAKRWQVVPWDVDLTWGDHMYGGGGEPFQRGVLQNPARKLAYQERLAEVMDLLFNPDETGKLIDEHAAMIWQGKAQWSLADADRAKWDYHPWFSSRYVMQGKTAPGQYYFAAEQKRFDVMIQTMKAYVNHRQAHLNSLLRGYRPPSAPRLEPLGQAPMAGTEFGMVAAAPGAKAVRWRLSEVTDPKGPGFDPGKPWHYEIDANREGAVGADGKIQISGRELVAGRSYRVRARAQTEDGRWSRWSAPEEFRAK